MEDEDDTIRLYCRLRGDQDYFALLVLAAERLWLQICGRLRWDQEQYAYPVPAVKSLRLLKSARLLEDQEQGTHTWLSWEIMCRTYGLNHVVVIAGTWNGVHTFFQQ